MRKCPICNAFLKEITLESEIVDICLHCRGIFFDKGELESIIHIVNIFQQIVLKEREIDTISETERKRQILCPACNLSMEKRDVSGIIIDYCNKCHGIWLDDNEINALKLAEKHIKQHIELYKRLGRDA